VGRVVLHASRQGATLESLSLDDLRRFSPLIEGDVKDALGVDASLRARAVTGGTAPDAVARALATARAMIEAA
jgi:argininosuccinate lyase